MKQRLRFLVPLDGRGRPVWTLARCFLEDIPKRERFRRRKRARFVHPLTGRAKGLGPPLAADD